MKHIITVPSRLLRAARLFQANDDPRHYLRGVHLNRKGYIEATDGRVAFRARCKACKELTESITIRIQGSAVGKGDEDARVYLDGDMGWITFSNPGEIEVRADSYGMAVRLNIATVDGKFTNLDRLFTAPKKMQPVSEMGIDGDYIAIAGKAAVSLGAPRPQMRFRFNGSIGTIWVDAPASKHDHAMLIMPCRL